MRKGDVALPTGSQAGSVSADSSEKKQRKGWKILGKRTRKNSPLLTFHLPIFGGTEQGDVRILPIIILSLYQTSHF